MTTPPPPHEPDEPAGDVTPPPPSLFDRLAEFEPEDDDLFDDEYDDEPAAEPSGDGAPAFHPVDPAAEPAADDEPAVTAYDDSAFAAVTDEPAEHEATPEPPARADHDGLEPEGSPDVLEPAEHDDATDLLEPVDDGDAAWSDQPGGAGTVSLEKPVPEAADTVSLEKPAPEAAHEAGHDTAVLDPFAAAPTPLAAVPAAAPVDAAAGTAPAEPVDEPPSAEEQAAEEPVAAEPAAEPLPAETGRRRRSGRRLTLPVVALLLMTALMAAATAYLWLQVRDHSRTESARRSGLDASRDAARLLFSYDYRTLDKDFQTGLALTTGEFRTQYNKTTTKVVADVAKQYKAVVKANVVGAGVVSATPTKVVTVIYVNQVTTSTRVTGEKVDLSRVRMTLERSNGRWLVTSVNAL